MSKRYQSIIIRRQGSDSAGCLQKGCSIYSSSYRLGDGIFLVGSVIKIPMILNTKTGLLHISSMAFKDHGSIPSKYTCEGENINPPIDIAGIPLGAKSLAIIVEDPDATKGIFDHWVTWNIPVTAIIEEDSAPGIPGINGFKHLHYGGPCPPSGKHRYIFKVYALSAMLGLPKGSNKESLQEEMEPFIIGYGELTGLYSKKQ